MFGTRHSFVETKSRKPVQSIFELDKKKKQRNIKRRVITTTMRRRQSPPTGFSIN